MVKVSKTIGPLHFEDLDPHRFEDLVRQLIYDFRDWKMIEGTGRVGSDENFDVRAWETIHEGGSDEESKVEDKVWLVQCKREKSITPKKMQGYIKKIVVDKKQPLYGIIFAARCDFSKKTRDIFIEDVRKKGIQEFRLWGRAELEDLLFQPKNDHLLFAYFGVSLAVRKKSIQAKIRSKLSTKRKVVSGLGDIRGKSFKHVLIRDANDDKYPYKKKIKDFDKHPKWIQACFKGHYHSGIKILVKKHYAYLGDDKKSWDCVEKINLAESSDNPWAKEKGGGQYTYPVWHFWEKKIPEKNRAWLEVVELIPYENIIDIDIDGDEFVRDPHIYTTFKRANGPFEDHYYVYVEPIGFGEILYSPKREDRIKFFPKRFPKPKLKV